MRFLSFLFFIILASTYSVFGQVRSEYFRSLFIDVDGTAGLMSERLKTTPISNNYLDPLSNAYQGKLKFTKGYSLGYNANVGYYIDKKRTFGIEAGFYYYAQQGKLGMDSFHVEFKSYTPAGDVFRQVISTDHSISESIQLKSMSIPLMLMYKRVINDNLFLTASAGVLYNLNAKTTYNTNANFDYEGIFKSEGNVPVYDNSVVPDSTDLLITKSAYNAFLVKNKGNGNLLPLNEYFKFQDSTGVAKGVVGLNEKPSKPTGTAKFQTGSLGYTAEIAANYRLMKNVYLRGGVYYTAQSFKNSSNNNSLPLTSSKVQGGKAGQDLGVNYNSLLNEVSSLNGSNYGITIGVRVYINKTAWKYMEPNMDRITPEGPKAK